MNLEDVVLIIKNDSVGIPYNFFDAQILPIIGPIPKL